MNRVIVWGYWVKNFGDDIFLKSLVNEIHKKNNIPIYISCERQYKKYYESMGIHTVCNDTFFYKVICKVLRCLGKPDLYFFKCRKNDYFVMLGGSLFAENKSIEIEKRQLINLNHAVKKTKASFIVGSNFGPFKSEEFYNSYLKLFSKVKDISFRDINSYNLFNKKINNIRYGLDIALEGYWDDEPQNSYSEEFVTFSIIDLKNRSDLCDYQKVYEQRIAQICNYYLKKGKKIVFLNFCEKEGDKLAYERVRKLIDNNDKKITIINYTDINSITKVIKNSYKLYVTRFHAIMMGIYFKKRIIPFIYNEKTTNALNTYTSEYKAYDIKEINSTDLKDIIECNQIIKLNKFNNKQLSELLKAIGD